MGDARHNRLCKGASLALASNFGVAAATNESEARLSNQIAETEKCEKRDRTLPSTISYSESHAHSFRHPTQRNSPYWKLFRHDATGDRVASRRRNLYFIADYHALTSVRDPKALRENSRRVALDFLACGL
jgi:hypothetical protein